MDIREVLSGSRSKYEISIISEGKRVIVRTVNVEVTHVEYSGEEYIIIYNSEREVIRDAYKYINHELRNSSINTKTLTATALVKLYSFLEIYNYDINTLGKKEISIMKSFLYGTSQCGITVNSKFITRREAKTINKYISIYRGYFQYLGIDNVIINEKIKRDIIRKNNSDNVGDSYKISERISKIRKVPKYITYEEYMSILVCIKQEYGLREQLMVRLMYEYGLRLGEVLGLTIEDIKDNCIIIRNRISDSGEQHSKTLYKPILTDEYGSEKCLSVDFGFNIIKINSKMQILLEEYIYNAHEKMDKRKRTSYRKYCKADRAEGNSFLEGDNYYLFINSNARPLGRTNWNKYLKEIYIKCGIDIDRDKKSKSLNHRLRHGCAMKALKDGETLESVMKILRHSSLKSVMVYINPTDEDEYKANEMVWDKRGVEFEENYE